MAGLSRGCFMRIPEIPEIPDFLECVCVSGQSKCIDTVVGSEIEARMKVKHAPHRVSKIPSHTHSRNSGNSGIGSKYQALRLTDRLSCWIPMEPCAPIALFPTVSAFSQLSPVQQVAEPVQTA